MSALNVGAPDSAATDRAQGSSESSGTDIIRDDAADAHLYGLALRAGCQLRLAEGGYLLSKWGLSKACPDARSVRALLGRIGGAA